jgi:hypothetical protein
VEAIATGGQVPIELGNWPKPGAGGVTLSFVNRLLRLTLLAPDITEAILDGRQPRSMQLEELTPAMPSGWDEQKTRLRFSSHDPWSGGCS